jgi:hypothetical protein
MSISRRRSSPSRGSSSPASRTASPCTVGSISSSSTRLTTRLRTSWLDVAVRQHRDHPLPDLEPVRVEVVT